MCYSYEVVEAIIPALSLFFRARIVIECCLIKILQLGKELRSYLSYAHSGWHSIGIDWMDFSVATLDIGWREVGNVSICSIWLIGS